MGSDANPLHMLFFPFMAPGHLLPLLDLAKIFDDHGARVTVLTTPASAAIIRPTIPNSVGLHTIPFPCAEFGLPEGCENDALILSSDLRANFFKAIRSLRHLFDAVLGDLRPHCVVSDMFMPWSYHVAAARGIPRLVFHSTSNFARCAEDAFKRCRSLLDEADSSVLLPGLPHRIEMLRTQVMDFKKLAGTDMEVILETFEELEEVEPKNYGAVINSFYELEPDYADYRREVTGKKSWYVGPVSLCNKEAAEMATRGGMRPRASAAECLEWLDRKPPRSVVYACFGSCGLFTAEQLREMAIGFEESGHPFIWVMRNEDGWAPEGYEERIKGRGMVIRGWAPQLLVLNHPAVGAFVTHCGWNSTLEAIGAGLPFVTWPLYAEQFYNERFLVEVAKIGVAVGSKVFSFTAEGRALVKAAEVEAAVRSVMDSGEEAEERRGRARGFGEMARRAVEKGGSSHTEVTKLIQELIRTQSEQYSSSTQ